MSPATQGAALSAADLEVLKSAFVALVDQMNEQIRRTCTSFVLYSGDCSCCLCDADGNIVMQGTRDIASHVGTLQLTAKAVLAAFDDLAPGDVVVVNDPFSGGTHAPDVRVVKPVFVGDRMVALTQSNGHWDDVGGPVPGSFNVEAKDLHGEGMRIPPVRIVREGRWQHDVVNLLMANLRLADERIGDLHAQIGATEVGEQRLLGLIERWGLPRVLEGFAASQDYVERLTRAAVAALPDGTWVTVDHIDKDPGADEGLVPVQVRLTIEGDRIVYDLEGSSHPIASFHNAARGGTFSALVAGTKMFFPDVPLNSGFYRVLDVRLPEGSIVDARPPAAVTGFTSGAFEKVVQATCELWSRVVPERAIACSFNLEYMLVGGTDARADEATPFVYHDWLAGGWGGRADRDGFSAGPSYFGAGLMTQPFEGQERLSPVRVESHRLVTDSGGPGRFRGGLGVEKSFRMTAADGVVASYCCDRERSVVWGIEGGMPGVPHGATLDPHTDDERYLGAAFAGVPLARGSLMSRPSSGGGGYGDPLERDPARVLEDVRDAYVSVLRAAKDYGVVVVPDPADADGVALDAAATEMLRTTIREERMGWLHVHPELVAARVSAREIDVLDAIRHHGVVIDRSTGRALVRSTAQLRETLRTRMEEHWR